MVLSAMPMAKRSLIGFQNKDELGGTEAIETSPVLERTNSINFLQLVSSCEIWKQQPKHQ
jgi:hypothetical protein